MISGGRKCKEIEKGSIGVKSEQKQSKNRVKQSNNRGLRDFVASAKLTLLELVSQPKEKPLRNRRVSAKAAILCETISQLRNGCEAIKREIPISQPEAPFRRGFKRGNAIAASVHLLPSPTTRTSDHLLRSSLPAKFRQSDMARTRGAKSSSPSSRKRVPRGRLFKAPLLNLRGQKLFPSGEARASKSSGEALSH
ncbi:hypothetical protein CK203_111399 [Vitis vinifera]|uniref:Uncharacterized protein n=1 Tax=Vitis vinifera TaxID=29760 RepID=A0A438FEY6_VITVI|nr:hypothetical protein CK203_111399 [Vitis vinifera]